MIQHILFYLCTKFGAFNPKPAIPMIYCTNLLDYKALVGAIPFCSESPRPRYDEKNRFANQKLGISIASEDKMADRKFVNKRTGEKRSQQYQHKCIKVHPATVSFPFKFWEVIEDIGIFKRIASDFPIFNRSGDIRLDS